MYWTLHRHGTQITVDLDMSFVMPSAHDFFEHCIKKRGLVFIRFILFVALVVVVVVVVLKDGKGMAE